MRVEDVAQSGARQRQTPERRRGGGVPGGEDHAQRDGAGAVTGRETLAEVRVLQRRPEELAGVFAPGADAANGSLEDQRGDRGGEDAGDDGDRLAHADV